jgi:hypothetical protein
MRVGVAVSEGKIVRIDQFKAERRVRRQPDVQSAGGEDIGPVLNCGPAAEPRPLSPQEISHRFVMLAFLRKVAP